MTATEIMISVFIALIGLCVGSFLNVVIYRLPRGERLDKPASHCPACGHAIRWYDNIPLLSYLILRAKCRDCKAHISFRYTLVEVANLLLWIFCIFRLGLNLYSGLCMLTLSLLLTVTFIDIEHQIVCDSLVIALLIIGVAMTVFCPIVPWYERLIGMGGALVFFLLLFYGSQLILKKEALGGGDVKLMAVCGLILGWKNIALATFLAAIFGCIFLLGQILTKKYQRGAPLPFVPFLALGIAVALFFGSTLLTWYLGFFGI